MFRNFNFTSYETISEDRIIRAIFSDDINQIKENVKNNNLLKETNKTPLAMALMISNNEEVIKYLLTLTTNDIKNYLKIAKKEFVPLLLDSVLDKYKKESDENNKKLIDNNRKIISLENTTKLLTDSIDGFNSRINKLKTENEKLTTELKDTKEKLSGMKRKYDEAQASCDEAISKYLELSKKKKT